MRYTSSSPALPCPGLGASARTFALLALSLSLAIPGIGCSSLSEQVSRYHFEEVLRTGGSAVPPVSEGIELRVKRTKEASYLLADAQGQPIQYPIGWTNRLAKNADDLSANLEAAFTDFLDGSEFYWLDANDRLRISRQPGFLDTVFLKLFPHAFSALSLGLYIPE